MLLNSLSITSNKARSLEASSLAGLGKETIGDDSVHMDDSGGLNSDSDSDSDPDDSD